MRAPNLWVDLDPELNCRDATLLAIHRYWLAKRGDRLFPSRADIDPIDLAPHLGNVVLIDVQRSPLRLRYRLIGTAITQAMNRDSTGKYYDEIYPETLLRQIYASFRWMIDHGRPVRTFGEAFYPDKNFYQYETLNLPLAANGRDIDMVLGGLVFHPAAQPPSPR
ncbi:MAG: PAS domain-containing protein [Thalassobaculum sp.]|uniref:PAS domain-containing protein n=1 Tax=Thalassobaculum sp. TaxID=2022740 RepID=UPI0032ED7D5F